MCLSRSMLTLHRKCGEMAQNIHNIISRTMHQTPATCPDTFAPSHRGHATRSAGCVGEQAEGKKAEKYARLAPAYLFQPVARDLRSYWVKVKGLPPRAGEASGGSDG